MPSRARRYNTKLNREIAYKGEIGKKREAFCIDYNRKKKELLDEFYSNQVEVTFNNKETISCREGCSYCCLAYMQSSVQECEAIVYYLYQHENTLSTFLKHYPKWRKKIREKGDIYRYCGEAWQKANLLPNDEKAQLALNKSERQYQEQNIPCPFLVNDSCIIYEVRPFTCAALIATTPGEWCSIKSTNKAKTYVTRNPIIFDTSFYYNQINKTVLVFMPLFVYSILKYGYRMLSSIPGLEDLEKTALEDAEIKDIIANSVNMS
jgi:Fe-S-cluster containining protein